MNIARRFGRSSDPRIAAAVFLDFDVPESAMAVSPF